MTSSSINHADVIRKTADYVRELLGRDASGHDWWHIHRVRRLALRIGQGEGADLFVVELAALLHDVADWKFHDGDETVGPRRARQWLSGLDIEQATIDHVCDIIAHVSFKGAGVPTPMSSAEGRVVQDADRLDALGAIGIARTFAYGAHAGHAMHDPDVPPEDHDSFAAYKRSTGTTVNHFHEKLLLLKERMNTRCGRALAEERHAFMEQFLDRFHAEWNGEV